MRKQPRRRPARRSQIENLESREVMSADPIGGLLGGGITHHAIQEEAPALTHHDIPQIGHHTLGTPDFWLDEQHQQVNLEEQLDQIEKSLASAHEQTGMDHVKQDYGFSGIGQTVAVIDSGIAYDHYALGEGLGSNYRVVGGWDFTENDADPYDDGTEGSHGTHVSGIVGADDGNRSGVAPGVDLVGLRVFSDSGAGYFSWVESALQWVHTNRDSFENPITTVNLSLGTNWNSDSIPSWAMLEDEFAQLKADGIFVSVSAGNSFSSYNTPGLSYPAASPHVVPVMSSDDSGFLSYFSQRHERAIAAPGRYIYSTVPDYAGNHNGVTDDWANFSGTSMAAPYVAGASVIIREAMEFAGYTGITQDTIFDHMMATADTVHDSATGANYSRLNVQAAIDALMPDDDFGNSVADAYDLGTINAGVQSQSGPMTGHIEKLDDADYFSFTAGATGTVTFSASNTTHRMNADWQGMGGEGWSNEGGDSYTMNVVAGQEYTVALSSDDGLGYYDLSFTAESTFTYTDWGAAGIQDTHTGLAVAGDTYFKFVAGQAGYMTAQALYDSGSVSVDLLDANLAVVGAGASGRADYYAQAGEELYLKVSGSAADVDFRLTNAVSLAGGAVTVVGTSNADAMSFTTGTWNTVSLNDVDYQFAPSSATQVNFVGGGGSDAITITGSAADETVTFRKDDTQLSGDSLNVQASGFSTVTVHSGGGADVAHFYDTAGDESYQGLAGSAQLAGTDFQHVAYGFSETHAYSSGGDDRAVLRDSAGNDTLHAYADRAVLFGDGFSNTAHSFGAVFAYASGGEDRAVLRDSAGDELVQTYGDKMVMRGADFANFAHDFELRFAFSTGGSDRVIHYDTAGNDTYEAWSDTTIMRGASFSNIAMGFAVNEAYSSAGGVDKAVLHGTEGEDVFVAWSDRVTLSGTGYSNTATGFEDNVAHGYGGADRATLHDSPENDLVFLWDSRVLLRSSAFQHYANGFETKYVMATEGNDRAIFMGSNGADLFRGWAHQAIMSGTGYLSYAGGFDSTVANSNGASDRAIFYDTAAAELYESSQSLARFSGAGFSHQANGYNHVSAHSTGGADRAILRDESGDSTLTAAGADATLASGAYLSEAYGFSEVEAVSNGQGVDDADVSAVDYALSLLGTWA